MFVKAGQQLTEEQERSAKEIEALRREVLESLRENQRVLQAKSESDDLAIAELAALLDTEAGVTAAGNWGRWCKSLRGPRAASGGWLEDSQPGAVKCDERPLVVQQVQ